MRRFTWFGPRWSLTLVVVLGTLSSGVADPFWPARHRAPRADAQPVFQLAQKPGTTRLASGDPLLPPPHSMQPIAEPVTVPTAVPVGRPIWAVDGGNMHGACTGWSAAQPLNFEPYAQGEYVGHARLSHVGQYRLRVDDLLEFVFRLTRNEQAHPYELNVGDEVRIESSADATLTRDLIIQPDGTLTLKLVGQVKATRQNVSQLRDTIETLYEKYYKTPAITVTPLKVNTKLEDLRAAVDRRQGFGGQTREARVTPEGTIALPAIGSVMAQGLTLEELKQEVDARYAQEVEGLEVTPVLLQRAPRYVYVLGEVRTPGRYALEGPTSTMQAISLAGGWNVGGNLRQIVIFRRGDDWRLLATMLDLRGAVYGKTPIPNDEVWLNDTDIVVVPKAPIRVFDDYVSLLFTNGLYQIAPFSTSTNFTFLNQLGNAGAAGS